MSKTSKSKISSSKSMTYFYHMLVAIFFFFDLLNGYRESKPRFWAVLPKSAFTVAAQVQLQLRSLGAPVQRSQQMTSHCSSMDCSVVELASRSLETAWKTCSLCTHTPLPSSHSHTWVRKQSPSQNSSRERDPTSSGCEPLRTKSACEKKAAS